MDQVSISRELLRQMQALCMEVRQQSNPRMVALAIPLWDAIRTALEQPAVDQPRGEWQGYTWNPYTAPQAQQPNGWIRAIDEEMVSAHLGVADITDSYEDAKRKLNTLICWHVDVSHDPTVNGSAQQPAPVQDVSSAVISGAIFDFAGFLTSHKDKIEVGSSAYASPMVDRIKEWSGIRGLSLETPDVLGWQMHTAQQPRKAVKLTDSEIGEMFKTLYGYFIVPTGDDTQFARAVEAAVLEKNGVNE